MGYQPTYWKMGSYWMSKSHCTFDCVDNDQPHSDSEDDDDTKMPLTVPNQVAIVNLPHPPSAIYWMVIDGQKYNYLSEDAIKERATLPPYKDIPRKIL
jgi:hypothetical protein